MIPFLDLKRLNAPYEKEFKTTFTSFLNKGWYILGEELKNFEKEYAAYCGTQNCIGTANGLDAIRLIFEGYKILGQLRAGDEVLVASNTYIATIIAIKQAGLIPVLTEASLDTYNFDFEHLESNVSASTKVILPTHLYGKLTDMEKVSAFAKAHKLLVITDCAQSHGATTNSGKRSGSLANAAAHSFYPTKNLGALGDAGAITTDDIELTAVLKKYRNYGFKGSYVAEYIGINSRLDELQAAFLRIKLRDLDVQNEKRRIIARKYLSQIKNKDIELPLWDGGLNHVWHLFVVRCSQRDQLQDYLNKNKITTIIHYPIPPHKQEALVEFEKCSFPITERIHKEVLSIPIDPLLSDEEVNNVIFTINNFTCL